MPLYVKNGKAVLFVHVPKAGGSSIERHFRQAEWDEHYFFNTQRLPVALRKVHRCSPQHMHGELLGGLFVMKHFDLVFMTVRHPLDRFCSEYGMRNPNASAYDGDAFVAWMERVFERYAKNPFVLDNHIRPQVEFRVRTARIFKLEEGLETIGHTVGNVLADSALIHQEVHHARRAAKSFARLRDDPRIIDGVRSFYARDFEAFGYRL